MNIVKPYWHDQTSMGVVISSELRIEKMRITVHHYYGLPATQWFGSCYDLNIERAMIGDETTPLDAAKRMFLKEIDERLALMLAAVRNFRVTVKNKSAKKEKRNG